MYNKPAVRRTYGKGRVVQQPSSPAPELLITPPSSPSHLVAGPSSSPTCRSGTISLSSSHKVNLLVEQRHSHPLTPVDENRSVQSTIRGFFPKIPSKRSASLKRPNSSSSASEVHPLTQLHLTHAARLRTCPDCAMSYVRGGEDDAVHSRHHTRVTRGVLWDGLGRGRRNHARGETGWTLIRDHVPVGSGTGRLLVVDCSWGGAKINDILSTVDTVLSSPPLPLPILEQCRLFLFVTTSTPPLPRRAMRTPSMTQWNHERERVVAVVVAQPIKWAMRVLGSGIERVQGDIVDSGGGVLCDAKPLPTPLGIHRLFTIPAFRGFGLARILLDAAAEHTVYGCTFDPNRGQVAFSQPTESGRNVMEHWGHGAVRVFVDDESQL